MTRSGSAIDEANLKGPERPTEGAGGQVAASLPFGSSRATPRLDRATPRFDVRPRETALRSTSLPRHVGKAAAVVVAILTLAPACAAPITDEELASAESNLAEGEPTPPPTAEEILAKLNACRRISSAPYAKDAGGTSNIHVCGLRNAVFWKADMDIDCDGRPSEKCNRQTDPWFQPQTAATGTTGAPLDAASLPFIVVPGVSNRWNYRNAGVKLGSVGAVIYQGKIEYGIVGDVGPKTCIGEASYAMAERLGINPNPATGGVGDGVTYVVFTGESGKVTDNESHVEAVRIGRERARQLLREN